MLISKKFALTVLCICSPIFAGKLRLKNGSIIHVPDLISIHNDLSDPITIHRYYHEGSELKFTNFEVDPDHHIKIEVNQDVISTSETNFLRIFTKEKISYPFEYKTYYHPDAIVKEQSREKVYCISTSVLNIIGKNE